MKLGLLCVAIGVISSALALASPEMFVPVMTSIVSAIVAATMTEVFREHTHRDD